MQTAHCTNCKLPKLQIAHCEVCNLQTVKHCNLQFAHNAQCTLHKVQTANCTLHKVHKPVVARRQQSVLTNQQLALRQLRSAANKLKSVWNHRQPQHQLLLIYIKCVWNPSSNAFSADHHQHLAIAIASIINIATISSETVHHRNLSNSCFEPADNWLFGRRRSTHPGIRTHHQMDIITWQGYKIMTKKSCIRFGK